MDYTCVLHLPMEHQLLPAFGWLSGAVLKQTRWPLREMKAIPSMLPFAIMQMSQICKTIFVSVLYKCVYASPFVTVVVILVSMLALEASNLYSHLLVQFP